MLATCQPTHNTIAYAMDETDGAPFDPIDEICADKVRKEALARANAFIGSEDCANVAADLRATVDGMRDLLDRSPAKRNDIASSALGRLERLALGLRREDRSEHVHAIESKLITLVELRPMIKAAYNVALMNPLLSVLTSRRHELLNEAHRRLLTEDEAVELRINEQFCAEQEHTLKDALAILQLDG